MAFYKQTRLVVSEKEIKSDQEQCGKCLEVLPKKEIFIRMGTWGGKTSCKDKTACRERRTHPVEIKGSDQIFDCFDVIACSWMARDNHSWEKCLNGCGRQGYWINKSLDMCEACYKITGE